MTEPRVLWNVRITMRDGVELANNVYLPPTGLEGGPYPVIFSRNPYNRQTWAEALRWRFFTEQGYAFVTQDCRGRFDSDGVFYPFFDDGPDAYDSIEWIAEQPWCTGKIGMMSGSYGGWTQWAAAREKPPHLTTLVSSCAAGKWGEELPWDRGGVSMVMFTWLYMVLRHSAQPTAHVDWSRVFQHLPLRTLDKAMGVEVPAWKDWIEHPGLDDYWKQGRLDEDFADLDIPALHLTGWYDGDQPGEMFFWDGMLRSRAASSQHLLVGPWTHGGVFKPTQTQRDVDYTPASLADMDQVHLEWFDHWLKGIDTGLMDRPRARWFYTGINEWRETDHWPPLDRVETPLYLHSGGRANTGMGDGVLSLAAPVGEQPADTYRYDPADVAQLADVNFFNGLGNFSTNPADARHLEMRDDVLTYTSEPLRDALYVSGRPCVLLHASSDCPDTDWIVGLADVDPSGRSVPLSRDEDHQRQVTQGGRLRARFREGLDHEVWMTPDEVYEFRIELRDVAHVFKPGHRIRLTVLSWDYPSMSRNLNTDESIADATTIRVATNSVHHTSVAPSHVVLPVEVR